MLQRFECREENGTVAVAAEVRRWPMRPALYLAIADAESLRVPCSLTKPVSQPPGGSSGSHIPPGLISASDEAGPVLLVGKCPSTGKGWPLTPLERTAVPGDAGSTTNALPSSRSAVADFCFLPLSRGSSYPCPSETNKRLIVRASGTESDSENPAAGCRRFFQGGKR